MNYFNQKSERVRFRPLTKEDADSWVEFFINNDRLQYLGIDLSKPKEVLAEGWVNAQLKRYQTQGLGHLAVELKQCSTFIGMAGVLPRVLNGKEEYEIAYSLKPAYWGQGFATEMAKTMKEFALKHIQADRFISIIDRANFQSANVAKKNGMQILEKTQYLGMKVDVFGIKKGKDY